MSALSLPTSTWLSDVRGTVAVDPSYWKAGWRGELSAGQVGLLALNLSIVALGLAAAVRRDMITGVLPLAAFLGYQLANAFGRTSGGRYGVPVDWIIVVYFALGLAVAVTWAIRALGQAGRGAPVRAVRTPPAKPVARAGRLWWTGFGLLLAGSLLVLPDLIIPRATQPDQKLELASPIGDLDQDYVDRLLENGGRIYSGRILYPHSSAGNANGEFFFETTRVRIPYPLVGFTMIGPRGAAEVRLPGLLSGTLPNYSEAIVLGCRTRQIVEAVLLIVTGPEARTLVREPLPPPDCHLPAPRCEDYGSCR